MIIGKKILRFPDLDSTNNKAKEIFLKEFSEGLVVVADRQLAGRGKSGASWFSIKDKGLYLSVIVCPRVNVFDHVQEIVLLGAEAVKKTITDIAQLNPTIKPPNDILISGKKVCGILVEKTNQKNPALIIGLGINLNHSLEDFPEELQKSASSLFLLTDKLVEKEKFLQKLIFYLDQGYAAFLALPSKKC